MIRSNSRRRWWLLVLLLTSLMVALWYSGFLGQLSLANLKTHQTALNGWVAAHPWARVDGDAPDKPLDNAVLSRLKKFSAMNKVKKVALKVGLPIHPGKYLNSRS